MRADRVADERWQLRSVPHELVSRYRTAGWWNDASLGELVADGLQAAGNGSFSVESAVRPWKGTLHDVDRAARSLATSLRAQGVGAGDVVVFQLPNWVEAGITFWATAYLGAVIVPIVHIYGAKEVAHILDVTDPRVVVTADQFGHNDYLQTYDELLDERSNALWLTVGETAAPERAQQFASMLDSDPLVDIAPVDPGAPALIGFTSGTTRDPKGVVHSHQTISFETRQLDSLNPWEGPTPITGTPVGHFIGMLNAFLLPLVSPRSVYLVDVWNPAAVLRTMLDERVALGGGATYFLTSLLDHPDFRDEHLPLMPVMGLGGSPVPVAVTERAERLGIKVFRSYGSTEHPSITGSMLSDPEAKRLRTDGRPLLGVDMRLDDDGQIHSRGPDCFLGYTDPALTVRAFDADGWYHTGDVGVVDDEGFLTITDRVSDIIIRGGENISAQEVEELMLEMEEIAEVSVVSEPDQRLGERAAAVVRARADAAPPTLQDLRDHLAASGLTKQKWPESLYLVTDFPRTPSGKVQKYVLRKELREGRLEPRA